jgi:hypothetical protein
VNVPSDSCRRTKPGSSSPWGLVASKSSRAIFSWNAKSSSFFLRFSGQGDPSPWYRKRVNESLTGGARTQGESGGVKGRVATRQVVRPDTGLSPHRFGYLRPRRRPCRSRCLLSHGSSRAADLGPGLQSYRPFSSPRPRVCNLPC